MPDYCTTVTASDTLKKVSAIEARRIFEALGYPPGMDDLPKAEDEKFYRFTDDTSAFSVEWDPSDGELYVYAENYADEGSVPDAFWTVLGGLLKARRKKFLEFGLAHHCSKACPGSFGGGAFRVYRNGDVGIAKLVFPKHD